MKRLLFLILSILLLAPLAYAGGYATKNTGVPK